MSNERKKLINDKAKVDQYLQERQISLAEPVSMAHGLEFLEYLINEGIADDFASAEYTKNRAAISNREVFPMVYMMNILTGCGVTRRTKAILTNEVALNLLGFTDEQIANGITKRGNKNQYGEGFERQSGIMASTTIIDNLACFEYQSLEGCFSMYVRRIPLEEEIDLGGIFILDSSIAETEKNYPGAKPTRRKNDDGEETDEIIWGFKVFILTSAKTMIPVAVHITTANDADSPMLLKMVEAGVNNLGPGKIKTVVVDRGFIDGAQLYKLKYEMGIDFAIPAKKNMDIWRCMTGLRNDNKGNIEEWKYGKKGLAGGYLTKGSVSYSQYAAEDVGYNKNKGGAPINGVVVTRWAGEEIAAGKEKVILTSLDTDSAIDVIKTYGKRSLIENCNFRELKQAAALCQLPQYKNKNTEKTAKIHMLLCIFTLTVFNFLVERIYTNSLESNIKIPRNIREFKFMKSCEKAMIFVMVKNYYHIYTMKEFLKLAGFTFVPRE